MVIGVEVSIVEIASMQDMLVQDNEGFLCQNFTLNERLYCLAHRVPTPYFAARFAAKEAVLKILGIGERSCFMRTAIDIRTSLSGSPYLVLEGRALEMAHQLAINQWHLSLTHARRCAGAFVIAERVGDAIDSFANGPICLGHSGLS